MLQFTNDNVARHFAATVEKDRVVHVPGIYSGLLSGIGIAAARKMLADGVNLLEEKPETPDPIKKRKPAAEIPADDTPENEADPV